MLKSINKIIFALLLICLSLSWSAYDQETKNFGTLTSGGKEQATGGTFQQASLFGAQIEGNSHTYSPLVNINNFYSILFDVSQDTTPPVPGNFTIKNNDAYTNTLNVSLQCAASDSGGQITKMKISNDNTNWTEVNYAASYADWKLSSGSTGERIVYIQYKDLANNWSSIVSDSITLTTATPNAPTDLDLSVAGGPLSGAENILTKTGGTVEPGDILVWRFRINNSDWTAWDSQVSVSGNNADGTTVYALQGRSINEAGNYTDGPVITKISIDRIMTGLPGQAPALPWSTSINPDLIDFTDCSAPETDQANYKIYWGKDPNATIANAGAGHSSDYDPGEITDGPGTYYLRACAADASGNYGPWQTVAVYHYFVDINHRDYYLETDTGTSINVPADATAKLVRVDLSTSEEIGHVTINAQELGLNLDTSDISRIIIDKDTNGNSFISVPSDSDLAATVNAAKASGSPIWIPVVLGKFSSPPIIYVSTENGRTNITGYNGATVTNNESDRIRNYYFDETTGYVSFEVNEFSEYGAAEINNIIFDQYVYYGDAESTVSIRVKVIDQNNDGVENAPVTFSIQYGTGGFESALAVTSNASGYAAVIFKFPTENGNTTVKAETTTNISNTAIMTVSGGLTAAELTAFTTWAAQFSPDIGGIGNDPDNDGVINLYEWNYGQVPTTNPNLADTDSDGYNDKWDAYPTNPTLHKFESSLNDSIVTGKLFAGTPKGEIIYADPNNMYVNYNEGADTNYISKNIAITVKKISGLAYERVQDGNLGEAYSNNYYRALEPGKEYSIQLSYINRGNDKDTYAATSTLQQTGARWTKTELVNNLSNVSRWQAANFEVKILPTGAIAFEKVTLNISLALTGATAKEYEGYSSAWTGGTFNNDGWYGGKQQFPESGSHQFLLEAEGYDLVFLSKTIEVSAPEGTGPGNYSALIPGSKLKFTIAVKNNNNTVATSVNLTDKIPVNCHLFYNETPGIIGASSWRWTGATNNRADNNTIDGVKFEVTIPRKSTVTLNYTVTVD